MLVLTKQLTLFMKRIITLNGNSSRGQCFKCFTFVIYVSKVVLT